MWKVLIIWTLVSVSYQVVVNTACPQFCLFTQAHNMKTIPRCFFNFLCKKRDIKVIEIQFPGRPVTQSGAAGNRWGLLTSLSAKSKVNERNVYLWRAVSLCWAWQMASYLYRPEECDTSLQHFMTEYLVGVVHNARFSRSWFFFSLLNLFVFPMTHHPFCFPVQQNSFVSPFLHVRVAICPADTDQWQRQCNRPQEQQGYWQQEWILQKASQYSEKLSKQITYFFHFSLYIIQHPSRLSDEQ